MAQVVKNLQVKEQFILASGEQLHPGAIAASGLGGADDDPPGKAYGKGHKVGGSLAQDTGGMEGAVQGKG